MVFSLFGLQWVISNGVIELVGWQGSFGGHQCIENWKAIPQCVGKEF